MPVPSTIADLSATAASNSPAGSDPIGTSLDDYLRAIQGIVKAEASAGADIASASSITIPAAGSYFRITGNTTIASIADSWTGRKVLVRFGGAITLTHSSGLIIPGAANVTTADGDHAVLVNSAAGVWRVAAFQRAASLDAGSVNGIVKGNGAGGLSSAVSGTDYFKPDTQLSHRNKIINGDFRINQRGYVSGATVGTNLYGHDRWKMAASGDTYTYSTTNNKTTITIPASKVLRQVIEGLNLQTGTYVLSWEGTAQGKIGAGALSASGVTGAITGGVDTTIEFGPGTVANVQLEIGTVATPFEHRPIGTELSLCQRYFWQNSTPSINRFIGAGFFGSATLFRACVNLPVSMRTVPTVSVSAAADLSALDTATTRVGSALTTVLSSPDCLNIDLTVSGATSGQGGALLCSSSNTKLQASAEL